MFTCVDSFFVLITKSCVVKDLMNDGGTLKTLLEIRRTSTKGISGQRLTDHADVDARRFRVSELGVRVIDHSEIQAFAARAIDRWNHRDAPARALFHSSHGRSA